MSNITTWCRKILIIYIFCFSGNLNLVWGQPETKLNVIFIIIDDLNDLPYQPDGKPLVPTPNIDRLAKRGVLFSNAHCASPKCAPSRAAIMTGLRSSTTGLYDNQHWWYPNFPSAVTLPVHFRNNGYRVAGSGKIFHHTAGNNPPKQWHEFERLLFRDDPWFRGSKLNYPWSKHTSNPEGYPFSGVAVSYTHLTLPTNREV